ncbi:YjcZ family sporulation protein [Halalkalibacter urbisdiaboli]|nr:YjcZ family sporulation protein [Halalkalibacter urbisdiaboli]
MYGYGYGYGAQPTAVAPTTAAAPVGGFPLIVVLFILLIIVGSAYVKSY